MASLRNASAHASRRLPTLHLKTCSLVTLFTSWVRRPTKPSGLVRRARALLLLEGGQRIAPTAKQVGLSERHLRKWAKRFSDQGAAGLRERTRSGRPPVFSPQVALHVVKLACERPDQFGRSLSEVGIALSWLVSCRTMALSPPFPSRPSARFCSPISSGHGALTCGSRLRCLAISISLSRFSFWWISTPARSQTGKESCVLMKKPMCSRATALLRHFLRAPLLPTRVEHEYKRGGALHLFAAFDTRTGKVTAQTFVRKRQVEFIALLTQLDKELPTSVRQIHLVLDNSSIHHGKQAQQWLALHSRFVCHFLPTHCSWMNQIEQWFSILQRKRLHISDFSDLPHLAERLMAFITEWNTHAHPFNWSTKSATRVMSKYEVFTPLSNTA